MFKAFCQFPHTLHALPAPVLGFTHLFPWSLLFLVLFTPTQPSHVSPNTTSLGSQPDPADEAVFHYALRPRSVPSQNCNCGFKLCMCVCEFTNTFLSWQPVMHQESQDCLALLPVTSTGTASRTLRCMCRSQLTDGTTPRGSGQSYSSRRNKFR